MVIESKNQYKDLLNFIRGKDVAISLMRHDFRVHPAESSTTIASICCGSEHHDIIFDHSESIEKLDMKELSVAKRFWVDDLKQFYHLTGFENVYDVKLMNWVNEEFYDDIPLPTVFEFVYKNTPKDGNKIVPLVKVIEYNQQRLSSIGQMSDVLSITRAALKYNEAALSLAKLENNGLQSDNKTLYTNYNLYTSTGRPSNTFGGINFAALNKNDGSRKIFKSRYEGGVLVELDYDAYHLRLLGAILDYKFPIDKSLHQYFADEVYHCSYEDAKVKSFQILYGNAPIDSEKNPFFYGVDRLAHTIQDYFSKNKCFLSHIYNKPFGVKSITDVNKNKLLNYFVQSYETERNLNVIRDVHKYLSEKQTKMVLYTYDSFLFDFNHKDGLETLKGIKKIVESDKFPVKVSAGQDYDSLEDITKRL